MNNLNPLQLLTMLQSGNPEQVARQIINQSFANDPTMQSLINMAEKGDMESIQQFASQFLKERGADLNSEMTNLMSALGMKM